MGGKKKTGISIKSTAIISNNMPLLTPIWGQLVLLHKLFFNWSLHFYLMYSQCVYMCASMCVEVRGKSEGSLLPPWVLGMNSGCQAEPLDHWPVSLAQYTRHWTLYNPILRAALPLWCCRVAEAPRSSCYFLTPVASPSPFPGSAGWKGSNLSQISTCSLFLRCARVRLVTWNIQQLPWQTDASWEDLVRWNTTITGS